MDRLQQVDRDTGRATGDRCESGTSQRRGGGVDSGRNRCSVVGCRTTDRQHRHDKRGRIIADNWWRTFICDSWLSAWIVWDAGRERESVGYDAERRDYERDHRQPTLKEFMIGLSSK
jgi:hypothetical protein